MIAQQNEKAMSVTSAVLILLGVATETQGLKPQLTGRIGPGKLFQRKDWIF
jgi:hypothetical protein